MEIPDSHLALRPGARILRRLSADHLIPVTFHLRRSAEAAAVTRFAAAHRLQVLTTDARRRSVAVQGTAKEMNRAFGVDLVHVEHGRAKHHSHEGPIHLPVDVAEVVDGVLGLDNRKIARPHLRHFRPQAKGSKRLPDLNHYLTPELAKLYDFDRTLNGGGECIGIIELGGGFRIADVRTYFKRIGLETPEMRVVSVNGARNRPTGRPRSVDSEVLLDVEVAGGAAPGARLVVYFAPADDRGFVDAVKAAVHDRENRPSVLSVSWASAESEWSGQALRVMNGALRDAVGLDVTVCVSSGDAGASCELPSGIGVEFPASSPYALACGGTRLLSRNGKLTKESVWNDLKGGFGATGGGVSDAFARPAYQKGHCRLVSPSGFAGRGVPDVAAAADPETGYLVRVDRTWMRIGGTSAAAPLWAGLIARINQGLKRRVGFVNPRLYELPSEVLRPVTEGDNGVYPAAEGWNACTGLGTPHGTRLLKALRRSFRTSTR